MGVIGVAEGTSIYVFTQDMKRIMIRADELYERFCEGEDFRTFSYSLDDNSRHLTLISDVSYVDNESHDLLMIWVTPYRAFRCTPNTKVLKSDGTYVKASELNKGDELMSIRSYKSTVQEIENRRGKLISIFTENGDNFTVSEGDVILKQFNMNEILNNHEEFFSYIYDDFNISDTKLISFDYNEGDSGIDIDLYFSKNGEEVKIPFNIPGEYVGKLIENINKLNKHE